MKVRNKSKILFVILLMMIIHTTNVLAGPTYINNSNGQNISIGNSLFLDQTNNRVGIGTLTPSSPFHVVGNGNITSTLFAGTFTGAGTGLTGTAASLTAGLVTNGVYTTSKLSALAATTSAELAGVISDETGSGGALVFASSPTITTPTFSGTASGSISGNAATVTGLNISSAGSTDLNSLITSGFYRINDANANRPASWGQLLSIRGADDTITQIYGDYSSGTLYTRSAYGIGGTPTWTSWLTLLSSSSSWSGGDLSGTGLAATVAANSVALTTDTTGNYAAGDAEAGAALTGDSATAFFSSGTLEVARGGTGVTSSTGSGNVVLSASPTFSGTISGDALDLSSTGNIGMGGTESRLYLRDTDQSTIGAKSIHANSNVIGFLNGASAWMVYWDHSGNQVNTGAITATTLDTGYGAKELGAVGAYNNPASGGYAYTSVNNDNGGNGFPDYADSAGYASSSGTTTSANGCSNDATCETNDIDMVAGYRLYAKGSGVGNDGGYNGQIVVTKGATTGQYINLIRAGNYAWSIGTVYNSNTFAIGNGQGTDSSFTNPGFTMDSSNNVNILGSLSKGSGSFLIDHPLDPENKVLRHSFVESPDMLNIYKGHNKTINQTLEIFMPEWFNALNGYNVDDYEVTVSPYESCGELWSSKDNLVNNSFTVSSEKDCNFAWVVYAIRHDPYAEAHRIVVEENKTDEKKGTCIHREACV